ncbi:MAG TPA: hypothetical protein DE038_11115 [Nitrospina sp.]|nr:hypothetical protein [Nitrospina sp.]
MHGASTKIKFAKRLLERENKIIAFHLIFKPCLLALCSDIFYVGLKPRPILGTPSKSFSYLLSYKKEIF